MSIPILATKLFIPSPRPKVVLRSHLLEQLNEGLSAGRKLTLISAPAGFGKTTLTSEWVGSCGRPVCWLSLDEGDNDAARFLTYFVAALRTVVPSIGEGVLGVLQSPQPPPIDSILITLLNEINTVQDHFVLVLDDYQVIDSRPVDDALAFILKHLPPPMHLVIATREDPHLPLAQLRARGQLTELRAVHLRFTPSEAVEFLNQVMELNLSAEDITALETRTEGWITGLQLAALSMQGYQDTASFIKSFTGSHRFVLDYLVEEVLQHQSQSVQAFLLRTSILERMCGPLCDAVLSDSCPSAQEILVYLERSNLFITPLDNERRWYRYHHLFRDLLRQRLGQSLAPGKTAELHIKASAWCENNSLTFEAFQHAVTANDIERAERLIESEEIGLHFRSVADAVLKWLASLPGAVLDARPLLRVRSASLMLKTGQTTGVEENLLAAERALLNADPDATIRDLHGQIACARATLALARYDPEAMITQSRRALEYLHPDNLTSRSRALWTLGFAYHVQGDRTGARNVYTEALAISQAPEPIYYTILSTTGLDLIQEFENRLYQATETYRRSLQQLSDQPPPSASEAYIGLAWIFYEWNDLDIAEQYGQQSLQLARKDASVVDGFVSCEVFLARLKMTRGDAEGSTAMLAETEKSVRQHNLLHRMPQVAAAQVWALLLQGKLAAAAHLARTHDLPINLARVLMAQGDASAALAVLVPFRQQMEAQGRHDERLRAMILQAIALHAFGETDNAVALLGETLALAEPGGFIRVFLNEGALMVQLLCELAARRIMPEYVGKLLAASRVDEAPILAFPAALPGMSDSQSKETPLSPVQPLIEPLTQRELKILQLITQGLSNQQISERLYLALSTVKGHNRIIFDKLQVTNRTEAVSRARELGLL